MPRLVIGSPVPLRFSPPLLTTAPLALTIAALAARSATALLPIQAQLLVEDVLHRKARGLVLALEIGLHLLAFLVLAHRLDRKPDTPLAAIHLHHDRFDLVADLEQRRRLVHALVAQLRNVDEPF